MSADTDTVVVTSKGGGGWVEHDLASSNCSWTDSSFTYVRSTKQLGWKTCNITPPATTGGAQTLLFNQGQKTLTEAEHASLDEALRAVTVTTDPHCKQDLPELAIAVTTASGTKTYNDGSDSHCHRDAAYADDLLSVVYRLDGLAGSSSYPWNMLGYPEPSDQP